MAPFGSLNRKLKTTQRADFARRSAPDEIDGAALEFARFCLNQPESHLTGDRRHMAVRLDGYSTGPETLAAGSHIQFDDIREILPLVARWCKLNSATLEIHYFDDIYRCKFTDSRSLCRMIETTGSANLCHELLIGASNLAKCLKGSHSHTPIRSGELKEALKAGS